MANPADIPVRPMARGGAVAEELFTLRTEVNKMITNLRVLTAKLDADATVTDTNYAALVTDAAASGPAKVTALF